MDAARVLAQVINGVRPCRGLQLRFMIPVLLTGAASAADPLPAGDLEARYRAAFIAEDWIAARESARSLLAFREQQHGATSSQLIVPLANLASVEAELGQAEAAHGNLARAQALLDDDAGADPALRFQLALLAAKTDLRASNPREAGSRLREILRQYRKTPSVTDTQRAEAYGFLLDASRALRDHTAANLAVKNLLATEKEHYGAGSIQRVPGLYRGAEWYRWSGQMNRERPLLEEAVDLLEAAFGTHDPRLAYPLRTLAMSYIVDQKSSGKADAALKRALGLRYTGSASDVVQLAQVHASLGDHGVVFGVQGTGLDDYRTAWKLIAEHAELGESVADGAFARPIPLYVHVPREPFTADKGGNHFSEGFVIFSFDVTADGLVEGLRVADKRLHTSSLPTPVVKAFRRARYRPRVEGGEPVATSDETFQLDFTIDERGSI